MTRALRIGAVVCLLCGAAAAQAPLPPGAPGELPAGHPPVDAPAAPPEGAVPPGHPPAGEAGPTGRPSPREDTSAPSPDLPAGVIEALINDAGGKPLPGIGVRLGILRQSVSEGDAREFKSATTNAAGKVRFEGMATGGRTGYRLTVKQDAAEYASASFNLREDSGQSLVLHVYPVTGDIQRAMVGMRGFVMVEPRDDVFQFEVLFRIFNVGTVTWVPDDLVIDLPRGWKGFKAQDSMADTRAVAEGDRGVRLLGTYAPGQHDVVFRFQVPNGNDETVEFNLALPPHMAEVQVMAESAKGMGFEVSGMSPARPSAREDGRRLLVTGRQLKPGEPEMRELAIRLTGIPTPGSARWIAAAIALVFLAAGLSIGLGNDKTKPGAESMSREDLARARKLLLDELVEVEKARAAEKIGPRTYEAARRSLIDALTRLEAVEPEQPAKPKKKRARAT